MLKAKFVLTNAMEKTIPHRITIMGIRKGSLRITKIRVRAKKNKDIKR
jgi:hypothetical protein